MSTGEQAVFQEYTLTELDAELDLRARYPEFPEYFRCWEEESQRVETKWKPIKNIQYGSDELEELDLFLPKIKCRGVVIFIHGGQWMRLDKGQFSFIAEGYLESGLAVLNLNYPLLPHTSMERIVASIRRAVHWAYRNNIEFGIPNNNIAIMGHSSGGHLAACVAATNWEVEGISTSPLVGFCAVGGIYDLRCYRFSSLNKDLLFTDSLVEKFSPMNLRYNEDLKCCLIIGSEEGREFRRQHDAFGQKIRESNLAFHQIILDGFNHFSTVEKIGSQNGPIVRVISSLFE